MTPFRPREASTTHHDDTAQLPRSSRTGPEAVGRMSKSKIAAGRYSEQHAFGMSTKPLTRPLGQGRPVRHRARRPRPAAPA
jgi:hypothetical protein